MKTISAAAKCLTQIPSALCVLLLAAVTESHAATIVWSGASGTDTNWSTVGNWAGGLPGAGDDVKFFNAEPTPPSPTSTTSWTAAARFPRCNSATRTTFTRRSSRAADLERQRRGWIARRHRHRPVLQSERVCDRGWRRCAFRQQYRCQHSGRPGNTTGSSATLKATLDLRGTDNFSANVNRIGVGGRSTFSPLPPDRQAGRSISPAPTSSAPRSCPRPTRLIPFPSRWFCMITMATPPARSASFSSVKPTPSSLTASRSAPRNVAGRQPSAGAWLGFNPCRHEQQPGRLHSRHGRWRVASPVGRRVMAMPLAILPTVLRARMISATARLTRSSAR